MSDLFMVATDSGVRVFDSAGDGTTEEEAEASAKDRNARAAEMGLTTRYVVVPFVVAEAKS